MLCEKRKQEEIESKEAFGAERIITDILQTMALHDIDFENIKSMIYGDSGKLAIPVNKYIALANTFFFNPDQTKNKYEKFHKAIFYIMTTSNAHLKDQDHLFCAKVLFTLLAFTKNTTEEKIKHCVLLFPTIFEKNEVNLREVRVLFSINFKFMLSSISNAVNLIMIHDRERYSSLSGEMNTTFKVCNEVNLVSYLNNEFPKDDAMEKDAFFEFLMKKPHWFDCISLRLSFLDIFLRKSIVLV